MSDQPDLPIVRPIQPHEIDKLKAEYSELAENVEPCPQCGFWVTPELNYCPHCNYCLVS